MCEASSGIECAARLTGVENWLRKHCFCQSHASLTLEDVANCWAPYSQLKTHLDPSKFDLPLFILDVDIEYVYSY